MEITKSARWGRSGRWRAGLAVAGVAAMGTASLLGPGTTAEAMGVGGGDARSRLQRDADAVRDTGATGLTVLARDASGRETQARSGTASLKDGGRVPFDAYYRIGSDTKTFTAVAALQLVGEGTLRLDDTVEQWLPGVVAGNGNDGSRITLRNLLQHTSGLANYTDIAFEDPAELTPERVHAQRFRSQTPEEQDPRTLKDGTLPDAPSSAQPAQQQSPGNQPESSSKPAQEPAGGAMTPTAYPRRIGGSAIIASTAARAASMPRPVSTTTSARRRFSPSGI